MPQNHPISVECEKTFEIDPLKISEITRRVICFNLNLIQNKKYFHNVIFKLKRNTLEDPEQLSSKESTAVIVS
jgi:hypothetical protein